ncbi:hypothetical protein PV325_009480 [Microctonus aethiopoides]|nr:hypothetical protein PV325_009480 [Microctonus aethiopoides]
MNETTRSVVAFMNETAGGALQTDKGLSRWLTCPIGCPAISPPPPPSPLSVFFKALLMEMKVGKYNVI